MTYKDKAFYDSTHPAALIQVSVFVRVSFVFQKSLEFDQKSHILQRWCKSVSARVSFVLQKSRVFDQKSHVLQSWCKLVCVRVSPSLVANVVCDFFFW